jgi:predicted alpha/beta hydrolase family esterase
VGHSLWATYLLHILDRERREPLRKAIFVSWFIHELGNITFDKLNKPFLSDTFNRERIRHNTSQSIVFHGDNDPYVPISEAEYLSKQLWAKLIIVSNWGHLNSSAGFSSFPILLEELLE